ncbi:flagellar export protein FliJ [Gorillibacterium massiliense]|uniref:flagellar export protein FliJ n=1 Tax=Gorillibacterium massiliense TaxID=1280390 RepID=UPI0004B32F12|nr:flagellar export protein FliJ [Gorillibacterium massiliense]
MAFRYSFQKIVDLKSNEKTQAEWVLSAAFGKLRQEENSLTLLEEEQHQLQSTLAKATEERTTISELTLYQTFINHVDREIRGKKDDIRQAMHEVDKSQLVLTEKLRQEKVWHKAREKAHKDFTAVVLKKEQETLDELAVTRYKRPS